MKRFFFNLWICFLIGAMAMGCAKSVRYATYQNKNPEFNFSLQYPESWVAGEFKEPKLGFALATFTDKKEKEGEFQPHFVVTVKKSAAFRLDQASVEAVVKDAIQRGLKHENSRMISRVVISVAGQVAPEITMAYKGASDIYSAKARHVLIREKIVVVRQGEMYYVIRYLNTEEDFPRLESVFRHALKTFKFIMPV